MVLLSAFATLCVLIVAVPLGIRYHIAHAEEAVRATVESLSGTIVVEQPVGAGPTPLSKGQHAVVREGTTVRVDEASEAFVTVLNHTLHLYPSTTLTLDRVRAPRYSASTEAVSVHLTVQGGRVDIGTALAPERPLDFVVSTLQAESRLAADGSYAFDVSNDLCETTVYRGHADVSALGVTAALGPGERTEVLVGKAPQPATGVARQLIANSDLSEPLSDGWRVYNNQGNDGGTVDGRVEVVVEEGRQAARLVRTGGHGNHCETVLEQQIDRQLPDPVTSLTVRATIKLKHQSLSGGGYLGFEYPLMIRITYRDVYDSEAEWVRGFYYQNVDGFPTNQGVELPRDRWYTFESENLLEGLSVRPFRIMAMRIYASGWDYDSLITDVQLIEQ
jgi:hypothetical protein